MVNPDMTNRREFLQMGAAALALLPISRQAFGDTSGKEKPRAFYKVIYDERFSDCLAFADEARRLGATVHGIQGNVTRLWYNDLYFRWKEGPATIAGLTLDWDAFCLKILAQDAGLRQVFQGDHVFKGGNRLDHIISGPAPMIRQAGSLAGSGEDWGVRMARLVCQFDARGTQTTKFSVSTSVKDIPDKPQSLVSWVIAPRRYLSQGKFE